MFTHILHFTVHLSRFAHSFTQLLLCFLHTFLRLCIKRYTHTPGEVGKMMAYSLQSSSQFTHSITKVKGSHILFYSATVLVESRIDERFKWMLPVIHPKVFVPAE